MTTEQAQESLVILKSLLINQKLDYELGRNIILMDHYSQFQSSADVLQEIAFDVHDAKEAETLEQKLTAIGKLSRNNKGLFNE